jgi:hypothetical protein
MLPKKSPKKIQKLVLLYTCFCQGTVQRTFLFFFFAFFVCFCSSCCFCQDTTQRTFEIYVNVYMCVCAVCVCVWGGGGGGVGKTVDDFNILDKNYIHTPN